jgi:hypothetical protein
MQEIVIGLITSINNGNVSHYLIGKANEARRSGGPQLLAEAPIPHGISSLVPFASLWLSWEDFIAGESVMDDWMPSANLGSFL